MTPWLELYVALERTHAEPNKYIVEVGWGWLLWLGGSALTLVRSASSMHAAAGDAAATAAAAM